MTELVKRAVYQTLHLELTAGPLANYYWGVATVANLLDSDNWGGLVVKNMFCRKESANLVFTEAGMAARDWHCEDFDGNLWNPRHARHIRNINWQGVCNDVIRELMRDFPEFAQHFPHLNY